MTTRHATHNTTSYRTLYSRSVAIEREGRLRKYSIVGNTYTIRFRESFDVYLARRLIAMTDALQSAVLHYLHYSSDFLLRSAVFPTNENTGISLLPGVFNPPCEMPTVGYSHEGIFLFYPRQRKIAFLKSVSNIIIPVRIYGCII